MFSRKLLALAVPTALILGVQAVGEYGPYTQVQRYQGASFFNGFNFVTNPDPTHGFVRYVDQATAQRNGLISTAGGPAYLGVDYTSRLAADGTQGGRQSVRVESKVRFTEGLFIMDVAHMPGGICGTWPAWWTFGPNWPNSGEIDIPEGVNGRQSNQATLHTSAGCSIRGTGFSGQLLTGDCAQSGAGCAVQIHDRLSYGQFFNSNRGGVYAMEWTGRFIHVWFFPRNAIPGDITAGRPTPWTWHQPQARFAGACNIPAHFRDHNMVIDTTFCGDWASPTFAGDPQCAPKGSCQAYVANNPGDFRNAYWSINYIAVYKSRARLYADAAVRVAIASNNTEPASTTQVPAADTNPAIAQDIQNNAAGATGLPPAPGVTPPPNVPAMELDQVPATLNLTRVEKREDRYLRVKRDILLEV